jgi:subtilisin family serine protease
MIRSRTIPEKILCLLAVLLLLPALASTGFAESEKLFEKAAKEGRVRVIVGLQLPAPFIPEGAHASAKGVERQREAIMDARERFLENMSRLVAGEYEQYAEWDSVPQVALNASAAALEHLVNSPLVTTIQEDELRKTGLASTTAHIGADDTWDAGFGGMGQTVVILDTGIDADHPFFGGRVVHEACWSDARPLPFREQELCPNGTNNQVGLGSADALTPQCWEFPATSTGATICDHGSHVAGISAGQDPGAPAATGYDGIAPEASIIAIQVFHRVDDCNATAPGDQPCVTAWDSDINSALEYVNDILRHHYNISSVNLSLGGGQHASACDGDAAKPHIDNLRSNGIATVIITHNDGWTDALRSPGCISTAVTVGGVEDPNDNVIHNMHPVVDLLAVSARVDSSVPDDAYANFWGTSMAAPQVTGAFAVIKAMAPSMSVGDIETLLETTGVLVTDGRDPCDFSASVPAGRVCDFSGITKPRLQLDAAVASLTETDLRVFKDCKPDQPMLVGDSATCTITVQNASWPLTSTSATAPSNLALAQ